MNRYPNHTQQTTQRSVVYLMLTGISKSYAMQPVLNDVTFSLHQGDRVGLVGANGVGKSTLLRIITGETDADGGSLLLAPGREIGCLRQAIPDFGERTLADLIVEATAHIGSLEFNLRRLEEQMTQVYGAALEAVLSAYGDVTEQYERAGGYALDARIKAVLDGLGVGHIAHERRFETLSGGEKARTALAMLLLQAPDVLLLDEPTNHLDSVSLSWLETFIASYQGAALLVSHDRQFLNRSVNSIVEIDEHTRSTKRYSGNYDVYMAAKRLERRKWEQDYAAQQEQIAALRLEVKVTARSNTNYRAHTDGDKCVLNIKKATHDHTVSRRIRAAEEKLRRIAENPLPRPPEPLQFVPDFNPHALEGRMLLTASNLHKAYGARAILENVSLAVTGRSRIVLVGPNGAGKSTLLRILAGEESADVGEVSLSPAAAVGYLDQEQRALDPTADVFTAYRAELPGHEQQLMAILLQSGLFHYDDLGKRVGELSIGQQRKLQIARLIAGRANLLLLDEPTNHVSFDVLEAFEAALVEFPGAIIAASHDRRFIEGFQRGGGEIWEVRDGHLLRDAALP